MKIALCLQGLSVGKNDKGDIVSAIGCSDSIKENIINSDTDVFIHTWNQHTDSIEEIKTIYNPKKSIFEEQIMFDDTSTKLHSTKSRWYSQMKSIELKKQYEKENDFTYDFVMVSRFDCAYHTLIDFTTLDPTKFYASHWEFPHNLDGFLDYWFITNSVNMDSFGDLYNKLNFYLNSWTCVPLSNHVLSRYHVRELGLENNISYIHHEHKDFNLKRQL